MLLDSQTAPQRCFCAKWSLIVPSCPHTHFNKKEKGALCRVFQILLDSINVHAR